MTLVLAVSAYVLYLGGYQAATLTTWFNVCLLIDSILALSVVARMVANISIDIIVCINNLGSKNERKNSKED